jgi:hypothetical protein
MSWVMGIEMGLDDRARKVVVPVAESFRRISKGEAERLEEIDPAEFSSFEQ